MPELNNQRLFDGSNYTELELLLRKLYFACRRDFIAARKGTADTYNEEFHIIHLDGGQKADGRHCPVVWPNLAAFIVNHRLNPEAHIRRCFSTCPGVEPPTPSLLMSPKSLEQAQNYDSNHVDGVRARWQSFCLFATALLGSRRRDRPYLTEQQAIITVINDPALDAGDLFRYCLARLWGAKPSIERYKMTAVQAYLMDPATYDNVLREYLDEDFLGEVEKSRIQLLRK